MTVAVVQPKWALKSMSIWSTIVGAALMAYQTIGPIITGFGIDVPVKPEDIVAVRDLGSNLIVGVSSIGVFIAGLIGRFRAGWSTAPVSVLPNAAPVKVVVAPVRGGDR